MWLSAATARVEAFICVNRISWHFGKVQAGQADKESSKMVFWVDRRYIWQVCCSVLNFYCILYHSSGSFSQVENPFLRAHPSERGFLPLQFIFLPKILILLCWLKPRFPSALVRWSPDGTVTQICSLCSFFSVSGPRSWTPERTTWSEESRGSWTVPPKSKQSPTWGLSSGSFGKGWVTCQCHRPLRLI